MNFKKIISFVLLGTMVFSLSACKEKTEISDIKVEKTSSENKQVLENLIESTDQELDNLLSLEDLNKYNKVGNINGEDLFAFNHISYVNLLKRFENRMSANVLENELYLRGFKIAANNIIFATNSEFLSKQKLYLNDFNYFTEISENDYIVNFPDAEKVVEDLKEDGCEELKFYKTLYTVSESAVDKDTKKEYEVFYVLGKKDNLFKILDAIYIVNGKMHYDQIKPHLSVELISNFQPNNFSVAKKNDQIENVETLTEEITEETETLE